MGIKPIGLSFKNTIEDVDLYNWIISHSNKSGFIKDILKAAKENEGKNKTSENKKVDLIDMNF